MAQFDVHRNPGRQRDAVPFVVILQSARFDRFSTRFVAALALRSVVSVEEHYLSPHFTIAGQEVVIDILNLATVPAARLGALVGSLADDESRAKLTRALDELVTQA